MKKTIFKSLVMGFAAFTAMTATAENKVYFAETEVTPGGGEVWVDLILENTDPNQPTGSWQCFIAVPEGLTIKSTKAPKDLSTALYYYDEEAQEYDELSIGTNQVSDTEYRIVATNMKGHDMRQGVGIIARLVFTASSSFTGGKLQISEFKGADFGLGDNQKSYAITNPEAYNIRLSSEVDAMEATTLADVVANGVNGKLYKIADDLHNVLVNDDNEYVFVSDGKGNWMKVVTATEEDAYYEYSETEDFAKGTLVGYLNFVDGNQTLTVTRLPEDGNDPVDVDIEDWNLAQSDVNDPHWHFRPKVNQIINLQGFYSEEESALYGYANKEGQYATLSTAWVKPNVAKILKDGMPHSLKNCAVQIKAPWDAEAAVEAPAKVAATDIHAYENYLVYVTEVATKDVLTGVENLNGAKGVVAVQYVNVAGQVSNTPFEGVNMVITRYADGSQVTSKVIK